MVRLTIDQVAEILAPTINDPNFRTPECAIRHCTQEGVCVHLTSSGSVFLCPEHDNELSKKISRLRGASWQSKRR